jgi:hypothetical protein
VEKWRRNGRDCPGFSKSGSLCQISTSAQFRGEVEKWKSGEEMAEIVRVFPNRAVSVKSAVRLSARRSRSAELSRSPSAQFRGEVEKWKSGEEMAETVRVFPNRAVSVKSAVRLSARRSRSAELSRSPSAQFRGEVEKWKSGEEMAEIVRFFPNRAVSVKSAVRLSARRSRSAELSRSPSAQFRGEVEKWKSGEEMADIVRFFPNRAVSIKSAVRLSARRSRSAELSRSPSAQFRGEVEKWKSGEEMAEIVRFFPNRAVSVKSAHQHNLGEKLKSGKVEKKWQRLSGFFQIGQSLSNQHISTSTHQHISTSTHHA